MGNFANYVLVRRRNFRTKNSSWYEVGYPPKQVPLKILFKKEKLVKLLVGKNVLSEFVVFVSNFLLNKSKTVAKTAVL
jgi:hypothetical protein